MLVTVQSDGPSKLLPMADAFPKVLCRRIDLEDRVTVVGHHGQNRFDVQLYQAGLDFRPKVPAHGRTNVIEAQQKLSITPLLHLYRSRILRYPLCRNGATYSNVSNACPILLSAGGGSVAQMPPGL